MYYCKLKLFKKCNIKCWNIFIFPLKKSNKNNNNALLSNRFAKYLEYYYPILVAFLGSLGNIISVIVFFGTKLRKQSASYYLSSLAINDTLYLLIQLVPKLSNIGIRIFQKDGFCQLFTYLAQVKNKKIHILLIR